VRPADGIEAVAELEDWFALGAEIQAGRVEPGDHPYVLSTVTNDPEEARRYVRRRWRTPRVVTVEEWGCDPFGWPEPISTQLLYGDLDLQLIERAEQRLREQDPYHAARRAA
jgi:hypothetical protein